MILALALESDGGALLCGESMRRLGADLGKKDRQSRDDATQRGVLAGDARRSPGLEVNGCTYNAFMGVTGERTVVDCSDEPVIFVIRGVDRRPPFLAWVGVPIDGENPHRA